MTTSVRLVDSVDGPPRTTSSLIAALAARLGALFVISGADAVGSLAAGVVRVGREVAKSADGRRMREAIQTGIVGSNGDALWRALRIDDWLSQMPASPVLDHLRNDYSLLLSEDLDEALDAIPAVPQTAGDTGAVSDEPATSVEFLLGLWFISGEVRFMLDALVADDLRENSLITNGPEQTSGRVLR